MTAREKQGVKQRRRQLGGRKKARDDRERTRRERIR